MVYQFPPISDEALIAHYNKGYRDGPHTIRLPDREIAPPVDFAASGVSFQRTAKFQQMIARNAETVPEIAPGAGDTLLDVGAYQGLFGYAAREIWGCEVISYDYNESGIAFARDALKQNRSRVTQDIYEDRFDEPVRFCTAIHAFEHLRDPSRFLRHLKDEILRPDGFLYLEVPNVFGTPLSDPTHFFAYSEQSLRRCLARNGFEIIDMEVHGEPRRDELVWSNDHMNISVLARPTGGGETAGRTQQESAVHIDKLASRIRRAHRRNALKIVARQTRLVMTETARLAYYLVFVLFLERLSQRASKGLKNLLTGN